MMTREERKNKAIELMKGLDIYEAYIEGLEKENQVCFFEFYAGYWVDQEPEVYEKMIEIEKQFGFTVYAITHEYTDFGECYSFLYVSKYKEDLSIRLNKEGRTQYVFAYVWNKTYEECSELGTIGVQSFGGGITRVA